jgi:hypothetical protein
VRAPGLLSFREACEARQLLPGSTGERHLGATCHGQGSWMVRRRDIAAAWYTHWADAASVLSEGSVMGGWRLLDLHAEGSHLLLQDVVFMRTRGVCWVHSAGTGSGLVGVPADVKV